MLKQNFKIFLFFSLIFIFGCLSLFFVFQIRKDYLPIFDFDHSSAWVLDEEKIFYFPESNPLGEDNFILSHDQWKDFGLFLVLLNFDKRAILLNWIDDRHFDAIFFGREEGKINVFYYQIEKKQVQILWKGQIPDKEVLHIFLQRENDQIILGEEGRLVFSIKRTNVVSGKIGFSSIGESDKPFAVLSFSIRGILTDGRKVQSNLSDSILKQSSQHIIVAICFFSVTLFFLFIMMQKVVLFLPILKIFLVFQSFVGKYWRFWLNATYIGMAVWIMGPVIFREAVFFGSFDNFSESFPLFIYSRNAFWDILNGVSLSLWNPYSNNGMPFFSIYTNMIYYPLNWPIFLFPEDYIFRVLSFRTLVELYFIGLVSYGLFYREFQSRKWAFLCSILFQASSFISLGLQMFPLAHLYLLFLIALYVVWSLEERKHIFNFIYLVLLFNFLFLSGNPAHLFYLLIALGVGAIYRLSCLPGDRKRKISNVCIVGGAPVVAFFMSAVRIIPVYLGIAQSNRIVENFISINDRFFTFVRVFIPELFGYGLYNAFANKNLGFAWSLADTPLYVNYQNTFFIYFGTFSAFIIFLNFVINIKGRGRHQFWRVHVFVAVLLGLLAQPFFGILNIFFFPFFHEVYVILLIPLGWCMLVGHTGLFLDNSYSFSFKKKALVYNGIIVFVVLSVIVALTYLFPAIIHYSRALIVFLFFIIGSYFFFHRFWSFGKEALTAFSLVTIWTCAAGLFFTCIIIVFFNSKFTRYIHWPEILMMFFLLFVSGFYINYFLIKRDFFSNTYLKKIFYIFIFIASLISGAITSFIVNHYFQIGVMINLYVLILLLRFSVFFFIAIIAVLSFYFYRQSAHIRFFLFAMIVVVSLMDLSVFMRQLSTSPLGPVFLDGSFQYQDMQKPLRRETDLVNFRIGALEKAGLKYNNNIIYRIPSFTGIGSHLSARFVRFINAFEDIGSPAMLTPGEHLTSNERFFDLSAVRYLFENPHQIIKRPSSLSRLNLFYNYRIMEDERTILEKISSDRFDPYSEILVYGSVPGQHLIADARSFEPIPIKAATSDRVLAKVFSETKAMLLFCDSFHEGWEAYVNGRQVPIYSANYNFMACPIPPGTHEVEFRFRPKSFFVPFFISMAGCVLFFLIIILLVFLDKKQQKITIQS